MKVQEIMEKAAIDQTGRALMYIKEALNEIAVQYETHIETQKLDIVEGQRFYELPNDVVKILSVRAKNHLNTKDEYRKIPRMVYEPLIEDADEV